MPGSLDREALLQDTELCAALGMYPDTGCCVLHPNIPILASPPQQDSNSNDGDDDTKLVHTCQICESEYLSGGLRSRKSFAYTIMEVQKLHNDKRGWREFKQNWENGSISSSATRTTTTTDVMREDDDNKVQKGEEKEDEKQQQQQHRPITSRNNKPVPKEHEVWASYTWQIILRTTQVKEWTVAEKEKELVLLRSKLRQQQQEEEEEEEEDDDNGVYDAMMSQSLPNLFMNQNLSNLGTGIDGGGAPPQIPHRQASSDLGSTVGTDIGKHFTQGLNDTQEYGTPLTGDTNNNNNSSKNNEAATSTKERAPIKPMRQASNDLVVPSLSSLGSSLGSGPGGGGGGPLATTKGRRSNSNRGANRRIRHRVAGGRGGGYPKNNIAPTVPQRQASNDLTFFDNNNNNNNKDYDDDAQQPIMPRSKETAAVTSGEPRRASSGVSGVSELTASEFDFDESMQDISESSYTLSTNRSLSTGFTSTFDRSFTLKSLTTIASTGELGHSSGTTTGSSNNNSGVGTKDNSTGDISFDPNTKEAPTVPPPPPAAAPSAMEEQDMDKLLARPSTTGAGTSDRNNREIQFDASQDIQFHVNHMESSTNLDFRRSVADMKFDASQQLLFEASQSFATPNVIVGRKSRAATNTRATSDPEIPQLQQQQQQLNQNEIQIEAGATKGSSAPSEYQVVRHNSITVQEIFEQKIAAPASSSEQQRRYSGDNKKNSVKEIEINTSLGERISKPGNNNKDVTAAAAAVPVAEPEPNDSSDSSDESDEFHYIPDDLPTNEAGFLQIPDRTRSLSPISCITSLTSMTKESLRNIELDDEEEEIGPRKGLHMSVSKSLPIERDASFDSDEETSVDGKSEALTIKGKAVLQVVDQIVNDKYGDSGLYTGSVTEAALVPHGRGVMIYENEREYNGDWEEGRW